MGNTMLPCRDCGAELHGNADAEQTTARVPVDDFEFAGKQAKREVPALICPNCGEVTPL